MKRLIPFFGVLLVATSASAAKLDSSDLIGRFLLTDQTNSGTQGFLALHENNDLEFSGVINGFDLTCSGKATFDFANQILISYPTCNDETKSALSLDFSKVEIGPFLEGGLVSVKLTYAQRKSTGHGFKTILSKEIDGKKLN